MGETTTSRFYIEIEEYDEEVTATEKEVQTFLKGHYPVAEIRITFLNATIEKY